MNTLVKVLYDHQLMKGELLNDVPLPEGEYERFNELYQKIKDALVKEDYLEFDYILNNKINLERRRAYKQGLIDGLRLARETEYKGDKNNDGRI